MEMASLTNGPWMVETEVVLMFEIMYIRGVDSKPSLTSIIFNFFSFLPHRPELSKNINADEAAALG